MSVQDLKKFGQLCAEDPVVRQKAKELGMTNLEGQVAYAKTLGLEFNADDIKALAKEAGVAGNELSEEQLEQVAGGCLSTIAAVVGVVGAVVGVAGVGVQVDSEASRRW